MTGCWPFWWRRDFARAEFKRRVAGPRGRYASCASKWVWRRKRTRRVRQNCFAQSFAGRLLRNSCQRGRYGWFRGHRGRAPSKFSEKIEKRDRHRLMVLRRYSPYLFKRGHAFERFFNSDRAQSFHSFGHRMVFDHCSRSAFNNQTPDRLAHWKRFNQRRAAEITATFATIASRSVIKHDVLLLGQAEFLEQLRFGHKLFLTIRANAPNESLRTRHQDRARNQKRLDPHVVQAGNRTGSIVRVERAQHLVTSQRRFYRDVGGFVVTNFTDHHDVGVLTQDRSQRGSEIETDVTAYRDLIDARELVLNRIFDRHDVVFGAVQLVQHRIERRRFTGTGRAGDKNHSVRRIHRLLEFRKRIRVHAHLVDASAQRSFIENTNDNFFAMRRRQDRNTQVDLFPEYTNPEPAVLRNAPLGNVQSRQNFDAGGNRELQCFRRRLGWNQFAIDAVTKLECIVKWLDVNVRRLFLDRLGQDQIYDLDDRRVFAVVRQSVEVDLFAFVRLNFDGFGSLRGLFRDLLHHLAHVADALNAAERVLHRALGRDHRNDLELHPPFQVVDREHVGRVGHGHKQFSVQARDRHQPVRFRHFARHQRHHIFWNAQPREIDRRRVQATAHAKDHVLLGYELPVGQNF